MKNKKCSSCKNIKKISEYYKQKDHKYGVMSMCKSCFNFYCIKRWIQRKIDMVKYFGGKCLDCNLQLDNSHYSVFEFHHRNPKEKDYSWIKLRLMSKNKILKELKKCDLLCANCHRIRHANIEEKLEGPLGIEPR